VRCATHNFSSSTASGDLSTRLRRFAEHADADADAAADARTATFKAAADGFPPVVVVVFLREGVLLAEGDVLLALGTAEPLCALLADEDAFELRRDNPGRRDGTGTGAGAGLHVASVPADASFSWAAWGMLHEAEGTLP
jgi:hypothetical protein